MKLYVNGDSHAAGAELESGKQSFAEIVAEYFGLTLVNQARGGCSNSRIIRTSKEWLEHHDAALVLIGWSTWEREEWMYGNQWYQINVGAFDTLPVPLRQRYRQWVTETSREKMMNQGSEWHDNIYNWHKEINQPHVFFNTMFSFFCDKQQEWDASFLDPYSAENSYYWYLKNKNIKTVTKQSYHYGAEGHRVWADRLIQHIEQNNLL